MNNKAVTYTIYLITSLIWALIYGVIAYFVIYRWIANGNMLVTYLGNIVFIVAILMLDEVGVRFSQTKNPTLTVEVFHKMGRLDKGFYLASLISFKSALYMFYIVALVLSRLTLLEPDSIPFPVNNFLLSIEYGLVLLIASDKLIGQLRKDERRMMKISMKVKGKRSKR